MRLAAEGTLFTVTYYPRQGAGEFVVPKQEVEDALIGAWAPGVQDCVHGLFSSGLFSSGLFLFGLIWSLLPSSYPHVDFFHPPNKNFLNIYKLSQ